MYLALYPRLIPTIQHRFSLHQSSVDDIQSLCIMPSFPWPEETGVWQTYDLHCHCGVIRWKMSISPPLLESQAQGKGIYTAILCDCSYCERNGVIACHPKAKNVEFTQGLVGRVTRVVIVWQYPDPSA